ncbi:MAG: bifunctional nuclease family protein [Myxococcales bacterium]|nr:bifunctional nuclease family protein [Myxococcales bacterium]
MASVEIKIHELRIDEQSQAPLLVLKELDGERTLTMALAPLEALSIIVLLERMELRRPTTHDLLQHVIDSLNARLLRVEINDFREDTFVSALNVEQGSKLFVIDARPSDAIALAVRCGAPILVRESILKYANGDIESPSGNTMLRPSGQDGQRDDLRVWLENLPDEQFGKYKM